MATKIFVNLPVKDLDRSKAFYTALGYTINPDFTDEKAASIVISDTIYVMLLTTPFFKTFTKKEIADAAKVTESILCLSAESRDDVDILLKKALDAGGKESNAPQDYGFMYGQSFQDPDGHQWEVMWMDMSAVPQHS